MINLFNNTTNNFYTLYHVIKHLTIYNTPFNNLIVLQPFGTTILILVLKHYIIVIFYKEDNLE